MLSLKFSNRKALFSSPLSRVSPGRPRAAAIFLDVDGVLMAFEPLINRRLMERGESPVPEELLNNRTHDYLSEAFPERFTLALERELVFDVFAHGYLRQQPSYPFLTLTGMQQLLSNPRLFILTRIPPQYTEDRLACLKEVFGVDLTERFLSTWEGGASKGDELIKKCRLLAVDPLETVLIDDRHDNLEGAMEKGACGLLVKRSYNLIYEAPLRQRFGGRFDAVDHLRLPEALAALLGEGAMVEENPPAPLFKAED